MAYVNKVTFLFGIFIVAVLSSTLIFPTVTAQDNENSEASLAKPGIIIFGRDGRPMYSHDNSPYSFYTDDENVTIRLKVVMPREDSMAIIANTVASVHYRASWENYQKTVLFTGAGDILFFDLNVPIGNQSIEVYASGYIQIEEVLFDPTSKRTVYGDSSNSWNFIVAQNSTPTPVSTPSISSLNLEQAVTIIALFVVIIAIVALIFKRRTHPKPYN